MSPALGLETKPERSLQKIIFLRLPMLLYSDFAESHDRIIATSVQRTKVVKLLCRLRWRCQDFLRGHWA